MPSTPHPLDRQGFVLNIFKESPWTSHAAVATVRRILHYRHIGHTGTLDPFATGILLCCVGRATKLSNYLMDLPKEYAGWMRFGVQTSTADISGEILREWDSAVPPLERLREAAASFTGEIQQVPPMVSALKHAGRRLYQLARQGITVERQARRVRIDAFEILTVADRKIEFRVRCARGTYVRTLVEDFGAALGASACVEDLCRTRVGGFRVEDSLRISAATTAEMLLERAVPMGAAVAHLPEWRMTPFWVVKLRQGHAPPWAVLDIARRPAAGEIGRLLGTDGELIAIGQAVDVPGRADREWYDALRLQLLRVV